MFRFLLPFLTLFLLAASSANTDEANNAVYETSHEKLVPDAEGYLPIDFDDPDFFHCSELDDIPSGRLMNACMDKDEKDPIERVERELRLGAYPDVIHWQSKNPVVMVCTSYNKTKSVELLVKRGANLLKKDPQGWTTCDWAAFLGITGVLKLCHKKGVDLVSHRPDSDYDYLHMACMGDKWGHGESVRYLLELGADVNIRSTKDKHSCMERYARFDRVQDVLKEYGAIHDEIPWEDL